MVVVDFVVIDCDVVLLVICIVDLIICFDENFILEKCFVNLLCCFVIFLRMLNMDFMCLVRIVGLIMRF